MLFYLTFNDTPSGIFSSQVIDVVKFMENNLGARVKLISFISLRGFPGNRKKIKQQLKDAIVIPMIPGVHRWKQNRFALKLLYMRFKPSIIIGRSVFATQLALQIKEPNKQLAVVYDGRGAIAAEWKEYQVITHPQMLNVAELLEKECIHNSDYRIAVSEKLLAYWREYYSYADVHHCVIPCTLNTAFTEHKTDATAIIELRDQLGFKQSDIIFVYSGSVAGWQSFTKLKEYLFPLLSNEKTRLLFLSATDPAIEELKQLYPGRVTRLQVAPPEVPAYLDIADYGILTRENTFTNRVASPVKFAEYLACGLPVIISENVGDYSDFVKNNNCGFVGTSAFDLNKKFDKTRIRELALRHFTKTAFIEQYKNLITVQPVR